MARQKGIIKLKGKIGDISFYKTQDGHLAREKGGVDAARIANDPAFVRTRENGAEFGSSASSGKVMRDALRTMLMTASDNRVTARLTKLMTDIKNLDTTSARGERSVGVAIAAPAAKALLKGFNFNSRAILGGVLFKPYAVVTGTGVITINGLVPINDIAFPGGATHMSLKSAWAKIDFATGVFDVQQSNTVNVPIDGTAGNVVLTPAAAPAGAGTDVYLLMIEFFQEVNGVQYSLKNGAYNAIDNGTVPQDATVQGFYNQEKTGSIDDYTNVDSLIEAGDYAQAMAINTAANANVVTEQTTKDYNTLWLSKFSNPDYLATTSDIVTISDIANQCIHKGGNAVAYARALLNAIYNHPFEYDDDCTEYKANLRIAQNTKNFESNGNEVHLYPNPNNGIFTLNYHIKDVANAEVIVEDVTGKLIYQKKLNMEITNTILQLKDTKNGIYFVKVLNGKEIISVNKVIINN